MEFRSELDRFFDRHTEQMVEDLRALVRIPSTKGPAQPGMPFGPGPAEVLERALEIARGHGLRTKNWDGYVGTVDLNGGPTELGILAHLDVVPQGSGWTRPAFDVTREGGVLYGRGVADDKGPAVAALYAMLALREIAPERTGNVRLILGTDEESGSADIRYYFTRESVPPRLFTPDADYPLINVEKGRLAPAFGARWAKSQALPRVTALRGGERANVVPPRAAAQIAGLSAADCREALERTMAETGVRFQCEDTPQGASVTALGENAHAARPETGNNALTALLAALKRLPLAQGPARTAVELLAALFPHGDTEGRALGWACRDEQSGALTLNFSILELGEEGFTAQLDSRTPVSADQPLLLEKLRGALTPIVGTVSDEGLTPPHCVPEDSPMVQTLLRIYGDYTGKEPRCLAIGGGTYVHGIPGGVAFGCAMPGVDNRMHGADEFALLDDLVLSAKMFAQAMLELCP